MRSNKTLASSKRSSSDHLFASPFSGQNAPLQQAMMEGLTLLDKKKPLTPDSSAWLGTNSTLSYSINKAKKATLPESSSSLSDIIHQVSELFEGLPNWGHPLNLSNICPQQNIAAMVSYAMSHVFSPNILEGEYAWNIARAELESASMLADLAGWNSARAGGIYTYGGSGCWLYHIKYALSRVLQDSGKKGVRTNAKIICSDQAHYAMLNSANWSGLGTDNIIKVRTVPGSNIMDVIHLEEILRNCSKRSIPIASVVCTMATTDANAFDPVRRIRMLLNKYPNHRRYGKALLYCDSVIGWSWLTFKNYNFDKNSLGFSPEVLIAIRKNYAAVKEMSYADAFGVDFHKGFCPIGSSIFVYKNAREFESLLGRDEAAYLQARTDYNPHDYTLEVSRPAGGSLAGWATLKSLGAVGFQCFLGRVLEQKLFLRNYLKNYPDVVCVNPDDSGFVTLLRIYDRNVDAYAEYNSELSERKYRQKLLKSNKLLEQIGEKLWQWFRAGKKINGRPCAYLSITKGFRKALYAGDKDNKATIYAIKIYPVSAFVTEDSMAHSIQCIFAARDAVK